MGKVLATSTDVNVSERYINENDVTSRPCVFENGVTSRPCVFENGVTSTKNGGHQGHVFLKIR